MATCGTTAVSPAFRAYKVPAYAGAGTSQLAVPATVWAFRSEQVLVPRPWIGVKRRTRRAHGAPMAASNVLRIQSAVVWLLAFAAASTRSQSFQLNRTRTRVPVVTTFVVFGRKSF